MQTPDTFQAPPPDTEREVRARENFWSLMGLFYRRRRFLYMITGLVAVASVIISLLLPLWYQGTAKVILPEASSSGNLTALLSDLGGSAAAALTGAAGGDYTRYLAILNSRTLSERVIEEFDLATVYETKGHPLERRKTLEALWGNTDFELDLEYEFLAINVMDKDPQRAAEMANFYVAQLNEMNARLLSENAANYRAFVQRRYGETEVQMDTARVKLQRFQEANGLIELEGQAQAFLTLMADYRAMALQGEIEYEALVRDFGEDNAQVQALRNRVAVARQKERDLRSGRDPLLPVSFPNLPAKGREYAELLQEVLIQAKILEFSRPLLEQAIFDEQREAPAVQVLDHAVPPLRKAKPKRSILVILATMSGFLLALIYIWVSDWWRRRHTDIMARLNANDDG